MTHRVHVISKDRIQKNVCVFQLTISLLVRFCERMFYLQSKTDVAICVHEIPECFIMNYTAFAFLKFDSGAYYISC